MSNETKDANKIDLSRRNLLNVAVAGLLAGAPAPLFPYVSSTDAEALDGKVVDWMEKVTNEQYQA